jgi:serine protease Do
VVRTLLATRSMNQPMSGRIVRTVTCVSVMAVALTVSSASAQGVHVRARPQELSDTLTTIAGATEPAVVEIFATSYGPTAGSGPRGGELLATQRASGSGVIVDPDGFIVTNAHVVRGAQHLRVTLPSGEAGASILAPRRRVLPAQIVGLDAETDLAVLKVDHGKLPFLLFGDSDALRPGQLVLAVGSPSGLQNSVSLGVVSAVARQLTPEAPMVFVQTDAAISPGSSGGPLIDLAGRVVGINTLLLSQDGISQGLGFAAPANIVRSVYEQLRRYGRVYRGDIGIRVQTLTPSLAAGLHFRQERGAVISDVAPHGPAALAGLCIGDIVLSLDGKAIENGRQLQINLYRRFVGDIATLEVIRDGVSKTVPVTVGERREPLEDILGSIDLRHQLVSQLGIVGVALDRQLASMLPALRVSNGVVVIATGQNAIDPRDGTLEPGDVIYAINRRPVGDLAALRDLLGQLAPGDAVVLHVDRRGELMFVSFTLE